MADYCAGSSQPFSSTNKVYVPANVELVLTCSIPGTQIVWLIPGLGLVGVLGSTGSSTNLGSAQVTIDILMKTAACSTTRVTIAAEHIVDAINTQFRCQNSGLTNPTVVSTLNIKSTSKKATIRTMIYCCMSVVIFKTIF